MLMISVFSTLCFSLSACSADNMEAGISNNMQPLGHLYWAETWGTKQSDRAQEYDK